MVPRWRWHCWGRFQGAEKYHASLCKGFWSEKKHDDKRDQWWPMTDIFCCSISIPNPFDLGKLRQDSFFEYLLKGYILFQDLELLDIFLNAYAAVTGSGLIISREFCCPPGLILSLFWLGSGCFLNWGLRGPCTGTHTQYQIRNAHKSAYFTCISMQHHAHTDAHAHTHTQTFLLHTFFSHAWSSVHLLESGERGSREKLGAFRFRC